MSIKFHASILKAVSASDYDITDEELGQLVETEMKSGMVSTKIRDTYLGVLVSRTQRLLSHGSGGEPLAALDEAHKRMLGVVTAKVITDDIKPNPKDTSEKKALKHAERQRRTGYARSAKSALARWIKAGGHVMDLDPGQVRKNALEVHARETEKAERETTGENTPQTKVAKRLAGLITALNQVEDLSEREALRNQAIGALNKAW